MSFQKLRFAFFTAGLMVMAILMLSKHIKKEPHHENTAHIFMLNTMSIWQLNGMLTYSAAPVQTWPNAARFNHYYQRLEDRNGNNYYVSHPPLAFIANYMILNIAGASFHQSGLQIILIFLLLAGGLLLMVIADRTCSLTDCKKRNHILLAVMAVYILNPVNLYAHSQHNFPEIWGQFFLIAVLAGWLFYLGSDRVLLARALLVLCVLLLSATDWMGLTLAVALPIAYRRQLKTPHIRRGIIIASSTAVITTGLVLLQYVQISGWQKFSRALGIRFLERSGYFGDQYTDQQLHILNPESWKLFILQIHEFLIGPGYVVLAFLVFGFLFIKKTTPSRKNNLLWLSALVPGIFFIVLFSAGVSHYIYTARFSPFLALMAAVVLEKTYHSVLKPVLVSAVFIFLMHPAGFWTIYTFKKHLPQYDEYQSKLNIVAGKIAEEKRNELVMPDTWQERDIIYLSWKSKRNLIWSAGQTKP